MAGWSPSDPPVASGEKYTQTFDEAHVSQVLSLIDELEQRREGGNGRTKKDAGKCRAGILNSHEKMTLG